mmetsp:Transcript_15316/g.34235  ORF Transcript_15316/g.34235 Transcript_15316/m.34235 type:complete len:229 (+) Transcript_15316:272-958(+)
MRATCQSSGVLACPIITTFRPVQDGLHEQPFLMRLCAARMVGGSRANELLHFNCRQWCDHVPKATVPHKLTRHGATACAMDADSRDVLISQVRCSHPPGLPLQHRAHERFASCGVRHEQLSAVDGASGVVARACAGWPLRLIGDRYTGGLETRVFEERLERRPQDDHIRFEEESTRNAAAGHHRLEYVPLEPSDVLVEGEASTGAGSGPEAVCNHPSSADPIVISHQG